MTMHQRIRWLTATALAVVAVGFTAMNRANAQPGAHLYFQSNPQQSVEVLTRGPVHEAFAETVTFNPEPGMLVSREPRDIIEELPPDQRPDGDNVAWIPGYWAWDDEREDYLWVSGIWRDLPPGRQWVPGYWSQSQRGYQWVSGYWADAYMNEVDYYPQPPESLEVGPSSPAPAINQGWIPGTWVWTQDRYAWRPGYWAAGRQNWVWVPAQYIWAPRGYVFSEGYWDYPVARRGVIFAPIYFRDDGRSHHNYSYSPSIAINLAVFSDQLFVRPRYRHYYFGDYYDNRYRDSGFFASFSYQSSRYGYDPIYAHRRWENRRNSDWDRHDRDIFDRRRSSIDERPPRTLLAQRERNARANRTGESRFDVATLFNQLTRRKDSPIRFRQVESAEREQLITRGRAVQNARSERSTIEARREIRSSDDSKDRPVQHIQPTRVKLPKPVIAAKPTNQLDRGPALPKRHRVPAADPKIQPRARTTDSRSDAKNDRSDARSNPPDHSKSQTPQADKKDEPNREAPKGKTKEDSREKSRNDKSQKNDEKNKP